MTQLLCEGVYLDLHDDFGLQFTHKNPLFAFDKLECERTTQFKLPSTPKNDAVLGLARIPAYDGAGMKRKFAAELQAGVVVKSGYLYVSSYDGKDYAAVLVTGELVRLQAVKNAGKIADYYAPHVYATYGQPRATTLGGYSLFETYFYANNLVNNGGVSAYSFENAKMRPGISLYTLAVNTLVQQFGIPFKNEPSAMQELVYLPEKYVDAYGNEIATQGEGIDLAYNMPDWTAIDLLKVLAYANGLLLNFESGKIEFVSLQSDLSGVFDMSGKVIDEKETSRALSGFAQRSTIAWKDADKYGLPTTAYSIANDNIEEGNTLYTIPAQPARFVNPYGAPAGVGNCALVWDQYATNHFLPSQPIVPQGAEFLARYVTGASDNNYLRPYDAYDYVLLNTLVQSLCDKTTQVKMSARLTMSEYEGIGAKTIILYRGTQYVWMERSLQNGVAQFTLAKLS